MKYLKQCGIIFLISMIGEFLHSLIPFPIPASIYGIVLLFLLLEFRVIKRSSIQEVSSFLLEIMPVMFIPAGVDLLSSLDQIRQSWPAFLLVTFLSTVIVMGVAGKVTQFVLHRIGGKHHE